MTYAFRPAKSVAERHGLFVALVGGTNSGKTFSALRLARGIAGPAGKIAVLDTEGGRTLHLKADFDFDVNVMEPPFRPAAFSDAARDAELAGYAVLVIDSFSMEWVGVGGVLDWQAEIHKRLGGKDSAKGLSWVEPKMAHKAMVYSFLQRRMPIIFAIRGEETFVPPNTKLFKPVCNKAFPFEVTVSFRLASDRKGVIDLSNPEGWKMEAAHRDIFHDGEQLSEEHGSALAAWAESGAAPIDRIVTLQQEAENAAALGMEALKAWWGKLGNADRKRMQAAMEGLKQRARAADEEPEADPFATPPSPPSPEPHSPAAEPPADPGQRADTGSAGQGSLLAGEPKPEAPRPASMKAMFDEALAALGKVSLAADYYAWLDSNRPLLDALKDPKRATSNANMQAAMKQAQARAGLASEEEVA